MNFFITAFFQKIFNQTATWSVSALNKTCHACECPSCIVYSSRPPGRFCAITLQPLQFHLSAMLASVIRVVLGPRGSSESNLHPCFLPLSSHPSPPILSLRQQLWIGDTRVPATRGETAKVIPDRTFSSSPLL